MKIIPFLIIYEITSVLCDPDNKINSITSSNNVELTSTTSIPNTTTNTPGTRPTIIKLPITFSPTIDNWNHTKILVKKGVDLRNHIDNSIQISTPSNGDFQSLIQNSSFWVDKSLLIKELWEKLGNLSGVALMAPPKWGKSINLSMLKFYLDLPLDPNGFELPREKSASYQYFHEGKVVWEDGTVYELDSTPLISGYEEHLANHPVIWIDGKTLDMDNPLESFRTMIHETYQRHTSLLNQLTIKLQKTNSSEQNVTISKDIKEFQSFYELSKIRKLNETQLVRGIRNLTRLLFNTYRRKVVVLFDDYDHFVQKAYFNHTPNSTRPHQQQIQIETIWGFFLSVTFKEANPQLEKILITGVLRANDEISLRTYKNFYNAYVFGHNDLYPYYGIFQPEYLQMVEKRGIDAQLAENATQWYGGYRTLSHPQVQIYATYPITRFLTTLQIRPDYEHHNNYLADFVNSVFRKSQFQRRLRAFIESFEQNGNHLAAMLPLHLGALAKKDYETIWEMGRDEIEYTAKTEEEVYSVMISIGYAAIYEYKLGHQMIMIRIPNRDMYNRYYAGIGNSTNSR